MPNKIVIMLYVVFKIGNKDYHVCNELVFREKLTNELNLFNLLTFRNKRWKF